MNEMTDEQKKSNEHEIAMHLLRARGAITKRIMTSGIRAQEWELTMKAIEMAVLFHADAIKKEQPRDLEFEAMMDEIAAGRHADRQKSKNA